LIFDFDGLLIDTETPAFVSTKAMYKEHVHELTLELWKDALGRASGQGFNAYHHLATLVGDRFDADKARAKRQKHKIQLCHQEPLRPGILDALAVAKPLGLTCTVASSSRREWVEGWLNKHDILKPLISCTNAKGGENMQFSLLKRYHLSQ
jgi:beta-phosphoglucomutase-like phosphatase (HAD superfamily)